MLRRDRFMQKTIVILLEDVLSRLESDTERLVLEAKVLSDEYLAWWDPKREMKLILKEPSQSHREAQTGQLRPVVRNRTNINKWYIEWTTEGCYKTKKINSAWSKSITPSKTRGYTYELLRKNSDEWELETAWNLELEFKVIRSALNAIHRSKVDIKKLIKRQKEDENDSEE